MHEYHTAILTLSKREQTTYSFAYGDSEGFVNFPLSIKGIVFSVLFVEKNDHIKISFRSHGRFDVNLFAVRHYNGGGHMNAAGAETQEPLNEAVKNFMQLVKKYKKELNYE